MNWSFTIGRLFGSELRVHITFFLLLAWVGYVAYAEGGPGAALSNVLFVLSLFVCVIAHEFGHALTARRYGIRTPDITLLPIGGLARLERMPEKPGQEIIVALAGPAVNIVIWAIFFLAFGAGSDPANLAEIDYSGSAFLERLALVNLFLALFNMIPAFPMDGGRVFRAALCLVTNRVRATRIAATAGQIVAFGLGFAGLSTGNPLLILIAFFVFVAAGAESNDVAMRSIARRMMARDAMITQFEALAPTDSLEAAGQALIRTTQAEFPVLNPDGTLYGVLTRAALLGATGRPDAKSLSVSELATREIPMLPLNAGLEKVLDGLHQGAPAVAICAVGGQVIGYVTRENIGELMILNGR